MGEYAEETFDEYDEYDDNETVEDRPSLNGHYCLATKEHYDKLVEDGYNIRSFYNISKLMYFSINERGRVIKFY